MSHLMIASHTVRSFAINREDNGLVSRARVGGKRLDSNSLSANSGSLEASQHAISKTQVISQQELGQFALANKDLLYVIDHSDAAMEQLKKKNISTRQDLEQVVVEAAHKSLNYAASKHLDREFLKEHVQIASLLVLNTGGLRDKVNKDESSASLISQGSEEINQDSYDQLAQKAQALFADSQGHPLDDLAFFKANPNAASYVLTHPDVVHAYTHFTDGSTNAQIFKNQVDGSYKDLLDQFAADYASSSTRSGTYGDDFFESNKELSKFVTASVLLPELPSAAQFLQEHPEYGLNGTTNHFNVTELVADLFASQAKAKVSGDSAIKEQFLSKNTGFARLMLKDASLVKDLNSSASKEQLSYLLGSGIPKPPSPDVLNELKNNYHYSYKNIRNSFSYVV